VTTRGIALLSGFRRRLTLKRLTGPEMLFRPSQPAICGPDESLTDTDRLLSDPANGQSGACYSNHGITRDFAVLPQRSGRSPYASRTNVATQKSRFRCSFENFSFLVRYLRRSNSKRDCLFAVRNAPPFLTYVNAWSANPRRAAARLIPCCAAAGGCHERSARPPRSLPHVRPDAGCGHNDGTVFVLRSLPRHELDLGVMP